MNVFQFIHLKQLICHLVKQWNQMVLLYSWNLYLIFYFYFLFIYNHFLFKSYANHYKSEGIERRTLYKAFGIHIIINVNGYAGKFDILTLTMFMGAGLGFLSISVMIAEFVMLNCSLFIIILLISKKYILNFYYFSISIYIMILESKTTIFLV